MIRSRSLRGLLYAFILLAILLVFVALWLGWYINGSLAKLEGEQAVAGLSGDVIIERDAQGIPTITADHRDDTAFALGFLHGQERFFQMDLLRRNSAGELAALVGEAALGLDRRIRLHQFRKRASAALAQAEPRQMALVQAYTQGVNAGLNALESKPFEYLLLNVEPQAWQLEDSLLALYSMYLDLQPEWNEHERSLAVLRDNLPADWFQFLTPEGGEWDSPIHGQAYQWQARFPQQPLATLQKNSQQTERTRALPDSMANPLADLVADQRHYQDMPEIGSNNWSVSGALSTTGSGMVANDMHLGLRVPNIWYRASWYLEDGRRVTGATLPGAPNLVVGSNEHIAWGFTNSYGDYHDSIVLKTNEDESQYLTQEGWEDFRVEPEVVEMKGSEPITVNVQLTRWGPVIGRDHNGKLLALRWVAHDPEGANLNIANMERANNVEEALDVAAMAGIPGQNLNVVDSAGNQAWTIMGRLPKRRGYQESGLSSLVAADWSAGDLGWDGYLSPQEYPRVVNPSHGRIWTANARVVSGELLDKVGRGDYALGARQQQIEKALFARSHMTEKDLLDIALDDRAIFLQRWQQLLLKTLERQASNAQQTEAKPQLDELKNHVRNWEGRASTSSVGYFAVKAFRQHVIDKTVFAIIRGMAERYQGADRVFWPAYADARLEYPAWALVTQQPPQHVPADYENWDDFLMAMAEQTLLTMTKDGQEMAEQTWGRANMLAIKHPLSQAVPALGRWLDMPAEPMSGDTYMPRVQSPDSGASERMVVSPGHEDKGIFHMATGQSGHFLSPYYDRGHRDWVEGNASPFLPGETQWRLVLKPE